MNPRKFRFECPLTDCCFNSHDNLRKDEFGEPMGEHFCMAQSYEELEKNIDIGVPEDCPWYQAEVNDMENPTELKITG